jgi:hypothetical protein
MSEARSHWIAGLVSVLEKIDDGVMDTALRR